MFTPVQHQIVLELIRQELVDTMKRQAGFAPDTATYRQLGIRIRQLTDAQSRMIEAIEGWIPNPF